MMGCSSYSGNDLLTDGKLSSNVSQKSTVTTEDAHYNWWLSKTSTGQETIQQIKYLNRKNIKISFKEADDDTQVLTSELQSNSNYKKVLSNEYLITLKKNISMSSLLHAIVYNVQKIVDEVSFESFDQKFKLINQSFKIFKSSSDPLTVDKSVYKSNELQYIANTVFCAEARALQKTQGLVFEGYVDKVINKDSDIIQLVNNQVLKSYGLLNYPQTESGFNQCIKYSSFYDFMIENATKSFN